MKIEVKVEFNTNTDTNSIPAVVESVIAAVTDPVGGESIIDFVRQLRHSDANSSTHPPTPSLRHSVSMTSMGSHTPPNVLGLNEYFFRGANHSKNLVHLNEKSRKNQKIKKKIRKKIKKSKSRTLNFK